MKDSSKAIMFPAAEREHIENDWHRSYVTFGSTFILGVNKAPFGNFYQLQDDTLAGGRSVNVVAERNTIFVLLPVVGGLVYQHQHSEGEVQAGEMMIFSLAAGQNIQLINPYENELVNYLQLWFSTDYVADISPALYTVDVATANNQLVNIYDGSGSSNAQYLPVNISIGKFSGRAEAVYSVAAKNGLFVCVLQGAFEVQYRLLESRDSLALWDVSEVEIEALSNEAILLVVELVVNS